MLYSKTVHQRNFHRAKEHCVIDRLRDIAFISLMSSMQLLASYTRSLHTGSFF